MLNQGMVELEVEIESLKRGMPGDEVLVDDDQVEDTNAISLKKMLKVLNRSHLFMRRCSAELVKILNETSEIDRVLPSRGKAEELLILEGECIVVSA